MTKSDGPVNRTRLLSKGRRRTDTLKRERERQGGRNSFDITSLIDLLQPRS